MIHFMFKDSKWEEATKKLWNAREVLEKKLHFSISVVIMASREDLQGWESNLCGGRLKVCVGLSKFYELKFALNHPITRIRHKSYDPHPHLMYLHTHFLATISAPEFGIHGFPFHHVPCFEEPK